jgi:hypothetical protein
MTEISYSGYRFPPEIIQQAIWLYVRYTLSFRDVEDLLASMCWFRAGGIAALKLMRKLSGEDIITSRNRALSDPAVNPAGAS